jgi:hypothetical protein
MKGMLDPGKADLAEVTPEANDGQPYALETSRALRFFQEDVDKAFADTLDMTGSQWGITHEVRNHPGSWLLRPYPIWYQIPGLNTNPNSDLITTLSILAFFLILLFPPLIPDLNRIPR